MLALRQIQNKYSSSSRACFHSKVIKLCLQGENMAKFLGTHSVPGCLAGLQAESRVTAIISVSPQKETAHGENYPRCKKT